MKNTRRQFFRQAGAGVLALGASSALPATEIFGAQPKKGTEKQDLFNVAVAGWTFVKFKLEPSLDMLQRAGVNYLCIKNFHLPYDSNAEQIAEFHSKCKAKGVTGYAVGPISMKTEAEADQAFAYAKRVGVNLVVGVPAFALLPYIDKKVKEYGYNYAIHNHGPGDELYPSIESIYAKVKDLDPRIGMCHDVGYTKLLGQDPSAETIKYAKRIFDVHIKDVTMGSEEGKDIEVGRGVIDFPALIRALRKIKYQGMLSLEYEKDNTDPLVGIAESIGYLKGVIKGSK